MTQLQDPIDPSVSVVSGTSPTGEPSIAADILSLVRERQIMAGDRIPTEVEIAAYFNASRQRVREGLRHLEALGVLKSRQGSGRILLDQSSHSLPALLSDGMHRTASEILNVLSVRQTLEVGFLPAVVSSIDGPGLENVRRAILRMEKKAAAGETFTTEDRLFHQSLYASLANPLLQSLLGRFWDLFEQIDDDMFNHTENSEDTVLHHRRILDAVERRDAALAQFHMNSHFYDVVTILEDVAARV